MYLALGFAVLLTLISSAVGVYYFERSGDLNYEVESQSVPALEASWDAAREAQRLRSLGLELVAAPDTAEGDALSGSVEESLARLESALTEAQTIPALETQVLAVQDAAYDVVEVVDGLSVNRAAMLEADEAVAGLRAQLEALLADTETSVEGRGCWEGRFEPGPKGSWTSCGTGSWHFRPADLSRRLPRSEGATECSRCAGSSWP